MARDPLGCGTCPVRDVAVCAGLQEEERRALARLGQRRMFQRGETIFAAGDEHVACATLVRGALKLSQIDQDGVERTVAIVHPSHFLAQLFAGGSQLTATALTTSELCLFPRPLVEREMRTHPALMERVLRTTVEQLNASRDLIALIGRRDARSRVAGLLLSLAEGSCEHQDRYDLRFELPLTRGELASLLGLTIETVSRQFSQLEAEGVLRRDGLRSIQIPDLRQLEMIAR
jgi:CRP/FNR family transcriptional regulator, anaerobic regulatory protein